MTGFFVVFEGGDGVGKSTQIDLLAGHLRAPAGGGFEVVTTREPGGTQLGQELRQAVMHGDHVAPRAEALLYAADRAHHIATKVRPALERGAVVVQDRYVDSSIVYQGGARGLGDEVERISRWATEDLLPDLTVVLDMEPAAGRMERELDRVERETGEHAALIREAFLGLAAREPSRYAVIDAARSIEDVAGDVTRAVADAMARSGVWTADVRAGSAAASPEGLEPWGTP
ncbi:dTMP kinase [Demequina muriae]|uniref:Thymidylate kinase n=1 Tax=Demequina muriae TaxID=3051664 RepID=A0ABT8GFH8_9MICO|nr:dTMP kinase [Demequina sp. EGI L300058]MDN4480187.1 dTMP kinase [Demequina sp. EGI L300058]